MLMAGIMKMKQVSISCRGKNKSLVTNVKPPSKITWMLNLTCSTKTVMKLKKYKYRCINPAKVRTICLVIEQIQMERASYMQEEIPKCKETISKWDEDLFSAFIKCHCVMAMNAQARLTDEKTCRETSTLSLHQAILPASANLPCVLFWDHT